MQFDRNRTTPPLATAEDFAAVARLRAWLTAGLALLTCSVSLATVGPCDGPEYRQFDFWIGDWQVFRPDGTLAGTNSIRREIGGCVLHERYRTDQGYVGESFNIYDAGRRRWHQTWVDSSGLLLLLDGGLEGGNMVLEGTISDDKGSVAQHRITWTPNPDGSVRQHWQTADASGSWTTAFDGLYRKVTTDTANQQ